jgi:hypothetical protein
LQDIGGIYNALDKHGCERLSEDYDEVELDATGVSAGPQCGSLGRESQAQLVVVMHVSLDAYDVPAVMTAVSDATSGRVLPEVVRESAGAGEDETVLDR